MVAPLIRPPLLRRLAVGAAVAGLAVTAPRLALLAAVLLSIGWVIRRDDGLGTWGVLYILLLLIVVILTMLVAGLALIHRLLGG